MVFSEKSPCLTISAHFGEQNLALVRKKSLLINVENFFFNIKKSFSGFKGAPLNRLKLFFGDYKEFFLIHGNKVNFY